MGDRIKAEEEQKRIRRGAEAAVFVDKIFVKKISKQVIMSENGEICKKQRDFRIN